MRRQAHGMQRAADGLRFDGVRDLQKKRAQLADDALGEIVNEIPVEVSGIATATPVWGEFDVEFDVYFVDAPEQRNSPLTTPHMSRGLQLRITDDDGEPLAIGIGSEVFVVDWIEDEERDVFTGATVRFGMWSPDADELHVHGYLHLTFTGYGAPVEDYDGS